MGSFLGGGLIEAALKQGSVRTSTGAVRNSGAEAMGRASAFDASASGTCAARAKAVAKSADSILLDSLVIDLLLQSHGHKYSVFSPDEPVLRRSMKSDANYGSSFGIIDHAGDSGAARVMIACGVGKSSPFIR